MELGNEVSIGQDVIQGRDAIFSWQGANEFVAVSAGGGLVHLLDHQGEKIKQLALPEPLPVKGIEWDSQGEVIAVLQEGLAYVTIWDIDTLQFTHV